MHHPGAELVADSRLDRDTDPYLDDYQIDGVAVLPAVLGLEAMSQAASALAGQPLRRAEQVRFDVPVLVRGDVVMRVHARRAAEHVTTVLRGYSDGRWTEHASALFRQAEPAPLDPPGPFLAWEGAGPGILDSTDLYGSVCFQAGRFRRVAFLPELSSHRCRALVRGGDDRPWFGPAVAPLLLGSPGLNDAVAHLPQACFPQRCASGCTICWPSPPRSSPPGWRPPWSACPWRAGRPGRLGPLGPLRAICGWTAAIPAAGCCCARARHRSPARRSGSATCRTRWWCRS